MNNMIKGSIAGATGVAMLMGGFGTYALWSDSRDLQANGIQSGELTIGTTTGVYDDERTTGAGQDNDWTASDKMVPGDVVSYTQVFEVTGTGKNLQGTIELAELGGSNNSSTITRSVDVVSSEAGSTEINKVDNNSFMFADPFGSATLTATVTYTFPAGGPSLGTTDQNKSVTTPASTFTIAQTS